MDYFNIKSLLKVNGKMSEQDAGTVGKMQALAMIIVSIAILLASVSLFF